MRWYDCYDEKAKREKHGREGLCLADVHEDPMLECQKSGGKSAVLSSGKSCLYPVDYILSLQDA